MTKSAFYLLLNSKKRNNLYTLKLWNKKFTLILIVRQLYIRIKYFKKTKKIILNAAITYGLTCARSAKFETLKYGSIKILVDLQIINTKQTKLNQK